MYDITLKLPNSTVHAEWVKMLLLADGVSILSGRQHTLSPSLSATTSRLSPPFGCPTPRSPLPSTIHSPLLHLPLPIHHLSGISSLLWPSKAKLRNLLNWGKAIEH
ncbi:hypothetical protein AAHA92_07176 [Salvia divinorum]|uniref:Uncharacterized protein n=1 Tax=Salvia divinorum TaxID=28513 RepID=A0ABD1I875_SALDI